MPERNIIDNILAHAKEIDGQLEHLKRMNTPLPIEIEVIQDTTYLPGAEEFKTFYDELNIYGISSIETGNGIVKIISGAGKTVVFGIRAIANIVADKLNMPIPIDTDQQITFAGKPNFVENVDAILKERMDWVQAEFNKILLINDKDIPFDPRIQKLCQDYHKLHSVPIIALCEYLKWEQTLENYRMQTETVRIQDKKASEVREIRNEYKAKLDEEKASIIKRAETAENNLSRLKQEYERDRKLLRSTQENVNAQKGETEELHKKFTESGAKNTRLEEELRIARTELEKLREKVKKTEGDEWSIDFTSTDDKPAFCNEATDDVITFPCPLADFKTNYKLQPDRTEKGERIFKNTAGEEIKIPESLAKAIPELIKGQQGVEKEEKNGKAKPKISLSANDQKVMDALKQAEEPLTVEELASATGIKTQNLYSRHIPKLIKQGCIEETHKGSEETHKGSEKAYQEKEE